MLEVERRYKVYDPEAMLGVLSLHGANPRNEQHVVDRWFAPTFVHSQADEDKWFDHDHGIAYRIRQIALPSGAWSSLLDSKQLTAANDHSTFAEEVVMQDEESAMLQFLKDKGYYNWLTIDKNRCRFASPRPELTIVMDTVAGVKDVLGIDTVLEIEYAGEGTRNQALTAIGSFADALGLKPSTLFEKSLTVEAMRVLARFE